MVRSTDWFSEMVPRGRPSASSTLEPLVSIASPAPVETPSAPPNCLVHFTVPSLPSAVAKALLTFCTLRCAPAKVPVVVPAT